MSAGTAPPGPSHRLARARPNQHLFRRSASTSTSRSASRSARTATSSSSPAPPRAGRRTGSRRSWRRSGRRSPSAPTPLDAALRTRRARGLARLSRPSISAAGRRRCCRPTSSRGCSSSSGERFGVADGRGDHDRGEPGARRARRRRRRWPGPGSTGSRSAPRAWTAASSGGSAGAIGRRTSRTRRRRPRTAASARSTSTCCTTCPAARSTTWMDTLEAALDLEPDHLSLYALTLDDPDAEGLTGPDGDHLPTPARRAPLARPGARRAGRGPGRRAVPPRRPPPGRSTAGAATRSATGRGRVTSAATTSRTGSAGRTRRSARAPTPSTARRDAGTPPISDATSRRSRRPTDPDGRRGCRRAAPRRSTRATAAAETAILGLRTDGGLPRTAAHEPPLVRRLRLGPRRRAADDRRGRPDRAHDPRPPPLERAVQPPRLRRSTGGHSPSNPLTLGLRRLLASLALNHREC